MSRHDDSYTRVDQGQGDAEETGLTHDGASAADEHQEADLPHSTDRDETDPDSGLPDPADRGEAAHREGEQ